MMGLLAAPLESVSTCRREPACIRRWALPPFTAVLALNGMVMGVIGLAAARIGPAAHQRAVAGHLADRGGDRGGGGTGLHVAQARKADMTLPASIPLYARRRRFVVGAAIAYDLWAVRNFTVVAPSWLLSGRLVDRRDVQRAGGSHHRGVLWPLALAPSSRHGGATSAGDGRASDQFGIYIANHGG